MNLPLNNQQNTYPSRDHGPILNHQQIEKLNNLLSNDEIKRSLQNSILSNAIKTQSKCIKGFAYNSHQGIIR